MNKVSTVVLISGAPGTGKTYLARRLVEELCPVVVLEKDAIKETLCSTPWVKAIGSRRRSWEGPPSRFSGC